MTTLGVRVPKKLHKEAKEKTGDIKLSDVVRGLLTGWVEGEVEIVLEDGKYTAKGKDKK